MFCSPSRFCCLFFSDELMAAGDGGGNPAISLGGLHLKGL